MIESQELIDKREDIMLCQVSLFLFEGQLLPLAQLEQLKEVEVQIKEDLKREDYYRLQYTVSSEKRIDRIIIEHTHSQSSLIENTVTPSNIVVTYPSSLSEEDVSKVKETVYSLFGDTDTVHKMEGKQIKYTYEYIQKD